jgi:predicted RNase H-like HicB family nuclease
MSKHQPKATGGPSEQHLHVAVAPQGAKANLPRVQPTTKLRVKVLIHEAEEGGFWAQVPALPGCVTEGQTRKELLANLRDAIQVVLLSTSGAFQPAAGGQEEEIAL